MRNIISKSVAGKVHSCMLKLVGKCFKQNRFTKSQSMSHKIYVNNKGKGSNFILEKIQQKSPSNR